MPRRLAKQQLRILIFPGTEVLWKHFPDVKPPQGHHILVPPPDRPSAEEAADALEGAAITANMVACVSAACGEPVLPETLGMPAAGGGEQAQQPAQLEPRQQQPQRQQQPASSDEAVSSASDDDVEGSRQQDSGGSQEPSAKRPWQE